LRVLSRAALAAEYNVRAFALTKRRFQYAFC
jgi:hypothetical protein